MFELSYAGVPFALPDKEGKVREFVERFLPLQQQFMELPPAPFPGKNLLGLPRTSPVPYPEVGIGQFYYPAGAQRWACFRGLADSAMTLQMVKEALPSSGATPQTFECSSSVMGAGQGKAYQVQTPMYMLPPRPLGITQANSVPGLYLITLVDERFYWQWSGLNSFHPNSASESTWSNLFIFLAEELGITLTDDGTALDPLAVGAYLRPEPDSDFWTNFESCAALLDAAAWNVGRTVIRKLNGTYELMSNDRSVSTTLTNRNNSQVVRVAGGDLFGNLDGFSATTVGQSLLPQKVIVTFPRYVVGELPHFQSQRFRPSDRTSLWNQSSYGNVYFVETSLSTAGSPYSSMGGFPGTKVLQDTCKALFNSEAVVEEPTNLTTLQSLALQLSRDFYAQQWAVALDETVPGTLQWNPEGIHDVLWTYDEKQATTRIFRQAWNYGVGTFQHSEGNVVGVGGPGLALTVRSIPENGPEYAQLAAEMLEADTSFLIAGADAPSFTLPCVAVVNGEPMEVTQILPGQLFTSIIVTRYSPPLNPEDYAAGTAVQFYPFVTRLGTTLLSSDLVLNVTGTKGTVPEVNFGVSVVGEAMAVTAVSGDTWTVLRPNAGSTHYPVDTSVVYTTDNPAEVTAAADASAVTLDGRNVISFTGDVAVVRGRETDGIAEAVVNVGASTIYGRIVGRGVPLNCLLTTDCPPTATTISVGELFGSGQPLPEAPFDIQIEGETMTVTSGSDETGNWTVSRPQQGQNATATAGAVTYPVGTAVQVLRTTPYAWVQVLPAGSGTFVDKEDGKGGCAKGAIIPKQYGAILVNILGTTALANIDSGSGTAVPTGWYGATTDVSYPTGEDSDSHSYVGKETINPAYEMNGKYVYADGRQIVRLILSPDGEYYEMEPVRAPIWVRLTGFLSSTVKTTLGGFIAAGGGGGGSPGNQQQQQAQIAIGVSGTDGEITVASNEDFPPTVPFWIEVDAYPNREVMEVYERTASTTWKVVRGLGGTVPVDHQPGKDVQLINPSFSWVEQQQTTPGCWAPNPFGLYSGADPDNPLDQPAYCTYPLAQPFTDSLPGGGVMYALIRPGPAMGQPPYWVFDWQYPIYESGYQYKGIVNQTEQVLGTGIKWINGMAIYANGDPTGIIQGGGVPEIFKYLLFQAPDATSTTFTVAGTGVSFVEFGPIVVANTGFIARGTPNPFMGGAQDKIGYKASLLAAYQGPAGSQPIPSGSYGGLTIDYQGSGNQAITRLRTVMGVVDEVEMNTITAAWGNGNPPNQFPNKGP